MPSILKQAKSALKAFTRPKTPSTSALVQILGTFDTNKVQQELGRNIPTGVTVRLKYFNEDHWQGGDGWVGPAPSPTSAGFAQVMTTIEKQFVSKNVVREVVSRHSDAVLARLSSGWLVLHDVQLEAAVNSGKNTVIGGSAAANASGAPSPSQTSTPPPAPTQSSTTSATTPTGQQTDPTVIDPAVLQQVHDIEVAITQWWKDKRISEEITKAVENMLLTGKGGIRLFVPSGKLVGKTVPTFPFPQILDFIYAEALTPDVATMVIDKTTMEEIYLHSYSAYDVANAKSFRSSEMCYRDPSTNLTIIQLDSENPNTPAVQIIVDMQGRNIFFEMSRPRIITDQVISQQKLMNMAFTMMSRNVVTGGFLERVITNAELPETTVTDSTQPGGIRRIPEPIDMGPGKIANIKGVVVENEDGSRSITTPGIHYKDPVDVQTFIETTRASYNTVLEDTYQTFAATGTDSLDTKIQARANFAASLVKTKVQVDNMVSWLVETTLQMCGTFSGNPTLFVPFHCISDVRPDTGPLTPEERKVVIEQYKTGLMSREAAMILLGTDNADEEIAKIESEKQITTPTEKALILTALSKTGWSLAWDQLPEIDESILGITPRDVNAYIAQLKKEADLQAPSGGNSGASGGSPQGSTNKPGSQAPGAGSGTGV